MTTAAEAVVAVVPHGKCPPRFHGLTRATLRCSPSSAKIAASPGPTGGAETRSTPVGVGERIVEVGLVRHRERTHFYGRPRTDARARPSEPRRCSHRSSPRSTCPAGAKRCSASALKPGRSRSRASTCSGCRKLHVTGRCVSTSAVLRASVRSKTHQLRTPMSSRHRRPGNAPTRRAQISTTAARRRTENASREAFVKAGRVAHSATIADAGTDVPILAAWTSPLTDEQRGIQSLAREFTRSRDRPTRRRGGATAVFRWRIFFSPGSDNSA